jgi:acetyl-CoA carboxylase carboxyltransferase component
MDGKTLAIGTFKSKLDHNFQIKSSNINEIKKIKEDMIEIEKRIKTDMDPYKAASQMDIDEIIKLEELRDYLCCISEICYQNHGYRRIKNPRIWSMHDLV